MFMTGWNIRPALVLEAIPKVIPVSVNGVCVTRWLCADRPTFRDVVEKHALAVAEERAKDAVECKRLELQQAIIEA